MSVLKKGQANVIARSRLMILLGEQLITDEVAAVSELVKNSYDADAEEARVTLHNVSNPNSGIITIWDNGNGMSLDTVLSSWLELGTLSKARSPDGKPRLSEVKKRVYLGEKGLGRLAVHKLGYVTELTTRRMGEDVETKLTIDWALFDKEGFLKDVPIKWELTKPQVFKDFPKGTEIKIKRLRRKWTPEIMERVKKNIKALTSPFTKFSDFEINVDIKDENAPDVDIPDMAELVKDATYIFSGTVDKFGILQFKYRFSRPDLPDLYREKSDKTDVRRPEFFPDDRKPTCNEFSVKFYAWDGNLEDQKAVFGDTSTYPTMIRPNSGVKVFRNGFRVYPYGNPNDDWLGMDARRVKSFELKLSRNLVIGAIELSSETNPQLIDKTDREGLIDNQAFRDFVALILGAISTFEAERYKDRRKLKEATGRIRPKDVDKDIFTKSLSIVSKTVWEQDNIPSEVKIALQNLIEEARSALIDIITEKEQPLLVAATFGITYLVPTHEVKRSIDEATKILRRMREGKELDKNNLNSAINHLQQAGNITTGLAKLSRKSVEEDFKIKRAAEKALGFMINKFDRNKIKYSIEGSEAIKAKGKENLMVMLLLNFLDNSFYWLLRKKPEEREIKIIADEYLDDPIIIVSDSGPGFEDKDINIVTLPFFTRKPDGMGLGLYIADRIARMSGGRLRLLDVNDFPGLLPGANIAVCLKRSEGMKK